MLTMVPIVYAIKEVAVHGFGVLPVILTVAGVGFGVAFVRRQLASDQPMLDMRLFSRGTFSGALLVNLLSVVSLVGFLYFVAQHLQLIVGLSPMEAGFALVPGMLAMIAAGLLVVPIARRVSARIVVPVALTFSAIAYLMVPGSVGEGRCRSWSPRSCSSGSASAQPRRSPTS